MGKNWTKRNVLLLAGLLAVITGLVVWKYVPRERPKVETAVAAVSISRGDLITRDMVTLKAIHLHGKTQVSADSVVGKIALSDIAMGAFFEPGQLGPSGLSARVPDGMRAVSVGVDAVINVGGFAQPGDRVDVVATYNRGERAYSETILQNVELLAAGEKVQASTKETAQPERKTVTLIVSPEEAQLVTLADNQGKLRLVLRNPGDSSREALRHTATTSPVTIKESQQPKPAVVRSVPISGGLPPQSVKELIGIGQDTQIVPEALPTVEVIRGNVKTMEVVSKG